SVICADREEPAARETVAWIEREHGESSVVVADVTSEDSCRAMIAATSDGGLDGLVLNVGIGRGKGLAETSAADWDLVFAANLRGHFLVVREALALLADGASIVFMSSIAGLQPGSRIPAYDASKAGLIGLARHTAIEGARSGVRANV